MTEAIIVALISGACTVAGIIISAKTTQNKIMYELKAHQAVTDTKMDELTREVREHNNFARRMPVVEEQIRVINEKMKEGLNHA